MALGFVDRNFKSAFVVQNHDSALNFIYLVKSADYQSQSDEQVLDTLKVRVSWDLTLR